MRIMIDANVIFSATLFRESPISMMVEHIIENHTLVLCPYVINEAKESFKYKFPAKYHEIEDYIENIHHVMVDLNYIDESKYPPIRDRKDIDVLANAIEAQVDILITGDTDFHDIKIDKPRIMKPRQFQDEYMKEKELSWKTH